MRKQTNLIALVFTSCLFLTSCNSGGTSSSQNPIVTINTYNYNPGNKTAVNVSIGGSNPIMAEIDTGSDMTVVNESVVGPNIIRTSQVESMTYGGGQNTVIGYLAYGSVAFTTTSGSTISTSPNAPLLVVTQGSVNQGGGNNAILGMRMNNQVSSRLYLPTPYNQMMILNRSESTLQFGLLSFSQVNNFSNINQVPTSCINYNVPQTTNNTCWDVLASSVNYSYESNGVESTINYTTVFDSGEANGSFYVLSMPPGISYDSNGLILTHISVTANTSKGLVPLPLTQDYYYRNNPGNAANPGNNYFNYYQVLFDQADGIIGFLNPSDQI